MSSKQLGDIIDLFKKKKAYRENLERNKKLLDKAVNRKNELEKAGMEAVVYKEEQFVYDCDSVEFNVYVMLWKDGLVNSSVRIEKIE